MKLSQTLPFLFLLVACAPALHSPDVGSDVHSATKVVRALTPEASIRMQTVLDVERLMEKGKNAQAEAIVDERLAEKGMTEGSFLPLHKAELLARRGDQAASVDLYLKTLRDPKMDWSPDSRQLNTVLEMAVAVGRSADADAIATQMIAHPCTVFYYGVVQTPRAAATPRERLAYAYLLVAIDVWNGPNPERQVRFARKAQALLPHSVPVLAQLAYALAERRDAGDALEAVALLRQARAQLTDPAGRADVEDIASSCHVKLDTPAVTTEGGKGSAL